MEQRDQWGEWPVMVLQDSTANYLLTLNAGGRMPSHMQMEGSYITVSTSGEDILSMEYPSSEEIGGRTRTLIMHQCESKKIKKTWLHTALELFHKVCQKSVEAKPVENITKVLLEDVAKVIWHSGW